MTLSPKLGVVGISTLWHFRLPLPIQMFIKVASSPRLSGIGMPSPILWSHPLKLQRIVLLSSLLWWELGTNSLITGPGEWLSFRRFTSNYPDPEQKSFGSWGAQPPTPPPPLQNIYYITTRSLSHNSTPAIGCWLRKKVSTLIGYLLTDGLNCLTVKYLAGRHLE